LAEPGRCNGLQGKTWDSATPLGPVLKVADDPNEVETFAISCAGGR